MPRPLARPRTEYRIAAVGSRTWNDYRAIARELDLVLERVRRDQPGSEVVLVSGGAQGADSLVRSYARQKSLRIVELVPDWRTLGKAAGMVRNRKIVEIAHEVVAFWDGVSRGTAHTIDEARKRRMQVSICGAGANGQATKLPAPPRAPERGPNDISRILDLPAIDVGDVPDLTDQFRRPSVPREELRPGPLLPIQSQALYWAGKAGGLIGAMGVGAGKTLATFLLPAQLQSKVAMLLVPPHLHRKTVKAYHALRRHWLLPAQGDWRNPSIGPGPEELALGDHGPLLYIVSLGQLSTASNSDLLDRIQPDLVIVDEAHALRGSNSARSRRFKRYFDAHPETRGCFLSGTITNAAITDYWHLCRWALRDGSPLPLHYHVAEVFDAAFGAKADGEQYAVASATGREMPAPSYVKDIRDRYTRWASAHSGETVTDHLDAYRRRVSTVPGFVATSAATVANSLTVVERRTPAPPPKVAAAVKTLEESWCTPAGEELESQLAYEQAARTLSCGFYNEWVWPNGVDKEWLEARRNWHRAVRQFLKRNMEKLDSPLLVDKACHRKDERVIKFQVQLEAETLATMETVYEAWQRVRYRPEPDTRAVWIDQWLCRDAVDLAKTKSFGPAIIWYESPAVGDVLEELSGFQRFGAGDAANRQLVELADRVLQGKEKPRTIIASVLCHGTGKDLQGWAKAIVVQCPSNGSAMEQLLGRLHRQGQKSDEVVYHVYLPGEWAQDAMDKARSECEYQEKTIGSPQKLCSADVVSAEDLL